MMPKIEMKDFIWNFCNLVSASHQYQAAYQRNAADLLALLSAIHAILVHIVWLW